jgi:Lrp/AsnC family transcriptional regulator, leucine-responsive regulatory protein
LQPENAGYAKYTVITVYDGNICVNSRATVKKMLMAEIDNIDRHLITLLQQDTRPSLAQMGHAIGLSVSSTKERIGKLVERGIITGFHAHAAPEALGLDLLALVFVGWSNPATETEFLRRIADEACILECHHVTGVWNYALKVRTRNTGMLEGLLAQVIKAVPGVERTETIIALSTFKETSRLPVEPPEWYQQKPRRP